MQIILEQLPCWTQPNGIHPSFNTIIICMYILLHELILKNKHRLYSCDLLRVHVKVLVAGAHFPEHPIIRLKRDNVAGNVTIQVTPTHVTEAAIMFTVPSDAELWTYTIRVCDSGLGNFSCSNELAMNKADLWWVSGDAGNRSTPGGWVRLFGKGLSFHSYASGMPRGDIVILEEKLHHALRSRLTNIYLV